MRAERQRDDQEMVFRGGCRLHELRVHGALAEELPGALVLDVASLVLFHERLLHLGGDREHAGLPPLRHRLPERPLFVADRPQASQRFLQPVDPDPLHVPQEPGQADARAAESGRAGGGDPVVGHRVCAMGFCELELLARVNAMGFRGLELLTRVNAMGFRGLELLARVNAMGFRGLELLTRVNAMGFRGLELLTCVNAMGFCGI